MGRWVSKIPNEDPGRCSRVLDNKTRMIGIDKDSLDKQVQERRLREDEERKRDEDFAKLAILQADALGFLQQEATIRARESLRQQDSYRQANQTRDAAREWDLNRPDTLKLDKPARVGDDDPRCGPASLQRFDGEDPTAAAREKAQMAQCQEWWQEQAAEQQAMTAAIKDAEVAYAAYVRHLDEVQKGLHAMETSARREHMRRQLEENLRLADERLATQRAILQLEMSSNEAELEHTLRSPFMTEDPAVAQSVLSPYRVRKDHWKGMSASQKQAILDIQLQQVGDARTRRNVQVQEDVAFAQAQADVLIQLDKQVQAVEEFKKAQAAKAAQFLQAQMMDKAARDKQLDEVYQNRIDPSYFTQFGTSHR